MAIKTDRGKFKEAAINIFKWIMGLLLLSTAVYMTGIKDLYTSLFSVDVKILFLSCVVSSLVTIVRWWRWHKLLSAMKTPDSFTWHESLSSYLVGLTAGLLTPGALGETARSVVIRTHRMEATGVAILEKVFDLAVTTVLCIPGIYILAGSGPAILWGILTLPVMIALILIRHLPWSSTIRNSAKRFPKILRLIDGWECITPAGRFELFWRTLLMYSLSISTIWILTIAFGSEPIWEVLTFIPVVYLIKVLPISPNGLGLREAAAATIFGMVGVPPAAAVNATLTAFTLNFGLPSLGGLIVLKKYQKLNSGRNINQIS